MFEVLWLPKRSTLVAGRIAKPVIAFGRVGL